MNALRSISILLTFISVLIISACDRHEATYMTGTLERDRVELKVESNEPIVSIHIKDGQRVSPGDLVLIQDSSRAEARLARFSGLRDQAAARLDELKRGPREESIRESRARLEAAGVRKTNALANLERTREVFDRGLSSEGRLDNEETIYRTAVAEEKAAAEALELLLNGTTVEELRQAEATLLAAQAQVTEAQVSLERTRIEAPVSGVVDKLLYQLGERPPPGTTIAVVLDDSRTFARVYVPEHLKTRVQPGRELDVRVDGIDDTFTGRVSWVSADASFTPYFALTEHDRSRVSYLAEIELPDAGNLPSGIPLEADFPGE
jgi:HlyD family secretion protein